MNKNPETSFYFPRTLFQAAFVFQSALKILLSESCFLEIPFVNSMDIWNSSENLILKHESV